MALVSGMSFYFLAVSKFESSLHHHSAMMMRFRDELEAEFGSELSRVSPGTRVQMRNLHLRFRSISRRDETAPDHSLSYLIEAAHLYVTY